MKRMTLHEFILPDGLKKQKKMQKQSTQHEAEDATRHVRAERPTEAEESSGNTISGAASAKNNVTGSDPQLRGYSHYEGLERIGVPNDAMLTCAISVCLWVAILTCMCIWFFGIYFSIFYLQPFEQKPLIPTLETLCIYYKNLMITLAWTYIGKKGICSFQSNSTVFLRVWAFRKVLLLWRILHICFALH